MWFRNGDIYFGQIYQNSTKLQHHLTTLKRKLRNGNTKYVFAGYARPTSNI